MVTQPTVVRTSALAIILLISVSLAGCVPAVAPPITGSPSPSPTSSLTPSPSPSPTVQPEEAGVPVSIPCESVISAQQMYDFSPTFVPFPSFVPRANSAASLAVEHDGTICRWVNETSSATIDISIARPAPNDLESITATAATGTAVKGVGDEAYFAVVDGVGVTHAFSGPFWVTVASEYFSSPFDAIDLVTVAVASAR